MKNLILYFLLLFGMVSCEIIDNTFTEATFTLLNDSNKEVIVKFYNSNIDSDALTIDINADQSYTGFTVESSNGNLFEDPDMSVGSGFAGDSIVIIFDNERFSNYSILFSGNQQISFSEPILRNPFRVGNYEEIGDQEFLYSITQEDYNNATPCDGPCE